MQWLLSRNEQPTDLTAANILGLGTRHAYQSYRDRNSSGIALPGKSLLHLRLGFELQR